MAIELANAYVSITVSAKGIKSDIEKQIGGIGDAAGETQGKLDKVGGTLTKTGAVAVAAATAIGTGLLKSAGAFQDLAIKSGQFASATGLNVDQSSRFIEVAGDLGVESGTLQSALNKMNRTAEASPDKFDAIGASILRTKSGAVDVQGTFLGVVDHLNAIQDPAAKAQAATDLLGKGWTGMADLIKGGSDTLKASLASVSDGQVIDDKELQQAKDYRANLDNLGDSLKNLELNIGKGAAPAIGGLATGLSHVVDWAGKADSVTGGFVSKLLVVGTAGVGIVGALSTVAGQALKMGERFHNSSGELNNFGKAAKGGALALGILGGAVAAIGIIDQLAGKTGDTTKEMNAFLATGSDRGWSTILTNFSKLSNATYDNTATLDNFFGIVGSGFDKTDVSFKTMSKTFNEVLQTSPKMAAEIVAALDAASDHAKAGDTVTQNWLKSYGIGQKQIDGFSRQVLDAAAAQDALSDSTSTQTDAVSKQLGIYGPYLSDIKAGTTIVGDAADVTAMYKQRLDGVTSAETTGALAAKTAQRATDDLADAQQRSQTLADKQKASWDALNGTLNNDAAILNLQDQFDDLHAKIGDAMTAAAKGSADASAKYRDQEQATIALKQAVLDYSAGVGGIPQSWATKINAEIDRGDLDLAEQQLAILARNRTMQLSLDMKGATGTFTIGISRRAKGGPVTAGVPYLVGDKYGVNSPSAELFVPRTDGYIHADAAGMATPDNWGPIDRASRDVSRSINVGEVHLHDEVDGEMFWRSATFALAAV